MQRLNSQQVLQQCWPEQHCIYFDGQEVASGGLGALGSSDRFQICTYASGVGGKCNGQIDEVAVWSIGLSASEVKSIYDRQSARYAGAFTSRVMDAVSSASWTTLSWFPTLPFFKELPDYSGGAIQNETSANYTSLVGSTGFTGANDLMTGVVGLWHLNEASGTTGSGSVKDDSGNALHATPGGSVNLGQVGKFGNSAIFSRASSDFVSVPAVDLSASSVISVSFWLKQTEDGLVDNKIILEGSANFNVSATGFLIFADPSGGVGNGGVGRMSAAVKGNVGYNLKTFDRSTDGLWHHYAVVFNKGNAAATEVIVYIDGDLAANQTQEYSSDNTNTFGNDAIYMMSRAESTPFNSGSLDEVAIWSRALHTNEIKQLYQRGASRLKLQVRTCATNPCTTETWKGPDGTSGTYFSELNNNTAPLAMTGDVKATLPSVLFSNFTSPPSANQYFQYRTIFETDSSTVALGPELKSVTIDPQHYPSYLSTDTSPANTIVGNNGVAFYDLNDFVETLGAGGCSSGVVYNLGLSSTGPWKYWDGAAWTTSNGSSAQANTAAALVASSNAALAAFGSGVGRGSIYFKAFLNSSGTSKGELDNLFIGGNALK